MKSAKNVIAFPREAKRDRDELAFLPAALEIVETPPSPIGLGLKLPIILKRELKLRGWGSNISSDNICISRLRSEMRPVRAPFSTSLD